MMGCVYLARCKVNRKGYVGYTSKILEWRRRCHEREAEKGSKLPFHCALRKHGFDNFEWTVIFDDLNGDELGPIEIVTIRNMGTKAPNGYNLKDGGEGGTHSEETKKKISETVKQLWKSSKHRARITEILKGRICSPETRAKLHLINKGKMHSTKSKLKMSKAHTGKTLSTEHKIKIGMAGKGAVRSPELRTRISKTLMGHSVSLETRAKISKTLKSKQQNKSLK